MPSENLAIRQLTGEHGEILGETRGGGKWRAGAQKWQYL